MLAFRKTIRGKLLSLAIVAISLSPQISWAAFDVQGEAQSADAMYGNAQNDTFRDAVEFKDEVSIRDRRYLESIGRESIANRYYFKALVARPTYELQSIRNKAVGGVPTVTVPEREESLFLLDLGFGRKWQSFAFEGELFIQEDLKYDANPIIAGSTVGLSATMRSFSLFMTMEYEIPRFFEFQPRKLHPYLNAGIGCAFKMTDADTVDLGTGTIRFSDTTRSMDFAYQIGVGAKYQITANVLLDLSYRYINLGQSKIGLLDSLEIESSLLKTEALMLGASYLMG